MRFDSIAGIPQLAAAGSCLQRRRILDGTGVHRPRFSLPRAFRHDRNLTLSQVTAHVKRRSLLPFSSLRSPALAAETKSGIYAVGPTLLRIALPQQAHKNLGAGRFL